MTVMGDDLVVVIAVLLLSTATMVERLRNSNLFMEAAALDNTVVEVTREWRAEGVATWQDIYDMQGLIDYHASLIEEQEEAA